MKFKIISIGKVKNQNLKNEIEELSKRISRLEIIELKEFKDKNEEIIKKKEGEEILKNLKSDEFKVLLWEHGKEFNTQFFYEKFKNIEQTICFIITGAFGPSEELKKQISIKLSLSQIY